MNKFKLLNLIPLWLIIAFSLSSCQAIADIFKAGMWVGIIGVVLLIFIILWVISKVSKK